jgi:hypothetical protein
MYVCLFQVCVVQVTCHTCINTLHCTLVSPVQSMITFPFKPNISGHVIGHVIIEYIDDLRADTGPEKVGCNQ